MMHLTTAPAVEDVERLRLALVERLSKFADDSILGAQLGTELNIVLGPSTYKSWLNEGSQNLRSFAEAFLVGIVTPTTNRRGNDYLFQIEGRLQQVTQSFGGALWKAFCTVRPTQLIRFERKANTLYLTPIHVDEATEDPMIAPVSVDEHKAMWQTFATDLNSNSPVRPQLIDIADNYENRSYAMWVAALKSEEGLFAEWGTFRVARIKALFGERVHALTTDEAVRARLMKEFDADYSSQRVATLGSPVAQLTPVTAPTLIARTTDHGTRQVLAKALETLDETQISKILVPLDVVIALLAQRKQ
jgi:hypothetical protein